LPKSVQEDVRKHSTLQSFGSAPTFNRDTKLSLLTQDGMPKIDLTKLSEKKSSSTVDIMNSPKPATPKTPSSEASDFASKIKEFKGIIRVLEKEKKELKEKLDKNVGSPSSPRVFEFHKILTEFKSEVKTIKENIKQSNEVVSDLKSKLSILENEKKGCQTYRYSNDF
jgi:predicted RNase H-like nuclease (RuvC/YqgF family)